MADYLLKLSARYKYKSHQCLKIFYLKISLYHTKFHIRLMLVAANFAMLKSSVLVIPSSWMSSHMTAGCKIHRPVMVIQMNWTIGWRLVLKVNRLLRIQLPIIPAVVEMMMASSSGTVSHINRVYIVRSMAVLRAPIAAKVVSCL